MSDNNELNKTIEELESEVLAELEEASDADKPKKGAVKSEPDPKSNDADDLGGADPDAKVEKGADEDRPEKAIGKKAAGAAKKAKVPVPSSSDASSKTEAKEPDPDEDEDEDEDAVADDESKKVKESASLKTKSQHLEFFGKMKASQVKEMLAAYQTSLAEEDDEDEDGDEDGKDDPKNGNGNGKKGKKGKMPPWLDKEEKQDEAVERTVKEIDIADDVDALMSGEESLSEEFKNKAATIFEAAVKSKVRTEAHRIYEEINTEKDTEIDTFKDELTTQVDTYLNYVVEEWTKENELAIERGLKGEIAEDFIGGLKQLFEDHYIDVPNEKYDVLEAQSEKIAELEEKINSEMQKNVEIKESNTVLVREQVITDVSDDLADTEVEKFKDLTADVDFTDENSFRDKLNTLKESYFPKTNSSASTSVDEEEETGLAQDVEISTSMEKYMTAIGNLK